MIRTPCAPTTFYAKLIEDSFGIETFAICKIPLVDRFLLLMACNPNIHFQKGLFVRFSSGVRRSTSAYVELRLGTRFQFTLRDVLQRKPSHGYFFYSAIPVMLCTRSSYSLTTSSLTTKKQLQQQQTCRRASENTLRPLLLLRVAI